MSYLYVYLQKLFNKTYFMFVRCLEAAEAASNWCYLKKIPEIYNWIFETHLLRSSVSRKVTGCKYAALIKQRLTQVLSKSFVKN